MENTLELAPPSALFRALLGACEGPGEVLQKPSLRRSALPAALPCPPPGLMSGLFSVAAHSSE